MVRPSGLIKRAREQALSGVLVELLDEVENVARERISVIDLNCFRIPVANIIKLFSM